MALSKRDDAIRDKFVDSYQTAMAILDDLSINGISSLAEGSQAVKNLATIQKRMLQLLKKRLVA